MQVSDHGKEVARILADWAHQASGMHLYLFGRLGTERVVCCAADRTSGKRTSFAPRCKSEVANRDQGA